MKYMLLAYTKPDWSEVDTQTPEFLEMCRFYEELGAELAASGEAVATEGLADPVLTRTVRPGDGGPVVSDGPFAETKEVLASFSIVDCASADRALEIAARVAQAVGDTIEVRPVMDGATGDEVTAAP